MSAEPIGGLRYYWNSYRALLGTGITLMLQYRFAMLIWAVWGFVGPLISLAVWTAATQTQGGQITNAGTGASFSRSDFAAYYLTFLVFSHLTMSWDAFEFAFRVRSGDLSPHLLKPIHPIHHDFSRNLCFKLATSAMLLPVWIVLVILLKPTPPASFVGPLLAAPALLLALVLRYVLQYALAAIAFWTTRVEAINQFYFALDAFLSGRVAPLALLPGVIGAAALYSPFRAMGSFPVELAMGRVPPEAVLPGFALQVMWLGLAVLFLRVIWRAGVRQYSAVGA